MPYIVDITSRLSMEKPVIKIGEENIEVDTSITKILKLQEKASSGNPELILEAIELVIGKEGSKKLDLKNMAMSNFMIIIIAIMAVAQGVTYEQADAVFRRQLGK